MELPRKKTLRGKFIGQYTGGFQRFALFLGLHCQSDQNQKLKIDYDAKEQTR